MAVAGQPKSLAEIAARKVVTSRLPDPEFALPDDVPSEVLQVLLRHATAKGLSYLRALLRAWPSALPLSFRGFGMEADAHVCIVATEFLRVRAQNLDYHEGDFRDCAYGTQGTLCLAELLEEPWTYGLRFALDIVVGTSCFDDVVRLLTSAREDWTLRVGKLAVNVPLGVARLCELLRAVSRYEVYELDLSFNALENRDLAVLAQPVAAMRGLGSLNLACNRVDIHVRKRVPRRSNRRSTAARRMCAWNEEDAAEASEDSDGHEEPSGDEAGSLAALQALESMLQAVGPTLRTLDLSSLGLRAEGIEALAPCFANLTCLESLRLGGVQAGARGLRILASCVPVSVRELHIGSNVVGGSERGVHGLVLLLLRLAPTQQPDASHLATGLEKLVLDQMGLGDQAIQAIAPCIALQTSLRSLSIAANPLGPASVQALADMVLPALPALEHLDATDTSASRNLQQCVQLAGAAVHSGVPRKHLAVLGLYGALQVSCDLANAWGWEDDARYDGDADGRRAAVEELWAELEALRARRVLVT